MHGLHNKSAHAITDNTIALYDTLSRSLDKKPNNIERSHFS